MVSNHTGQHYMAGCYRGQSRHIAHLCARCSMSPWKRSPIWGAKCIYTDNIACAADNIAGSSCLSAAPTLLCPANSTHSRHHTSDWPKIIASWSNMKVPEKLFLCTGSCAVSLLLQISFIVSEFRSILRGGILIFSPLVSHLNSRVLCRHRTLGVQSLSSNCLRAHCSGCP